MGRPMAQCLARSDFPLVVWNRTSGRAALLASLGARIADSSQALAAQCGVVITMVSDAAAVRTVLCGSNGTLAAGRPRSIAVDEHHRAASGAGDGSHGAADGIEFLDAPVSASVSLAEQGTLTGTAGGPRGAFASVAQVLRRPAVSSKDHTEPLAPFCPSKLPLEMIS
jgi:3-hydroxyisobutyrate dehydrogenase